MTTFAFNHFTRTKKSQTTGTVTLIGTVDIATLTGPFVATDIFGSLPVDFYGVVVGCELTTNSFAGGALPVLSVGDATDTTRFITGHATATTFVKTETNVSTLSGAPNYTVTKGDGFAYLSPTPVNVYFASGTAPTAGTIKLKLTVEYDLSILS